MSHFTVAVFTATGSDEAVDALLAPYCEEVKPGDYNAEFFDDDEFDTDLITGRKGYWANPSAKWDWYTIGGRWDGLLRLKNGGSSDVAKVSDCDFSRDEEAYARAKRFYEVYVEKSPLREGENESDFEDFFKPEYYSERYGDSESYARAQSEFSTHAMVTEGGEWFEQGRMGWFGVDDATQESIQSFDKVFREYLEYARTHGLYITIVDCHI